VKRVVRGFVGIPPFPQEKTERMGHGSLQKKRKCSESPLILRHSWQGKAVPFQSQTFAIGCQVLISTDYTLLRRIAKRIVFSGLRPHSEKAFSMSCQPLLRPPHSPARSGSDTVFRRQGRATWWRPERRTLRCKSGFHRAPPIGPHPESRRARRLS